MDLAARMQSPKRAGCTSRGQPVWPLPKAIALLAWLTACTTTVVPPPSPTEPRPVFILDHGRHTSLVLPHPQGLVRYAYGDWQWYAEVETGPTEATSAVLWPTRAALGRRVMEAPPTAQGVRHALKVGIQHLHTICVPAADADALRSRLDAIFRANLATAKFNAAYDLEFVEHPEPYSACHNSNHVVAEWLQQMGSGVEGSAFWAAWEVEDSGCGEP